MKALARGLNPIAKRVQPSLSTAIGSIPLTVKSKAKIKISASWWKPMVKLIIVTDIYELDYYDHCKVVAFRCEWVDINSLRGLKRDGFTIMSFRSKRTRANGILNHTIEGGYTGANHEHRQNVEDVACQDLLLTSKAPQRGRISSSNEHSNTVQSANDEDADNLNSNNSRIPEWADHVSFDEWEKVEMGDRDGNKKIRGSTILSNHVWTLPPGDSNFLLKKRKLEQIKITFILLRAQDTTKAMITECSNNSSSLGDVEIGEIPNTSTFGTCNDDRDVDSAKVLVIIRIQFRLLNS
ncbi:LOW QUALITY PROTEIN: hypothetical protein Cgig2_027369 [Carnegiea gigantea]|uniref:DUF4216 domain-containing protein n=1 Tax=Carnegiea gigantea TaxID=171969 RepID=A0A9Q1KBI4_9CARY|nr:LOW QUALITY PROTEIN: hypothetical protein Cgig2_027369 [Carnegiea gigantea]